MSLSVVKDEKKYSVARNWSASFFSLIRTWELYPILCMTIFYRLYRINTVVFVDDDASVFRLAHDAFQYGLWPITSNRASIGNLNFPLVVYLFMLPASFSANPLWGEVMVAVLNIIAVILCYIFTRRYYGRLAAAIATLLYAGSAVALLYSGDIWPQNLLPPFVMLFMLCLFRGVVARRRGWLLPALILLGILYQLHGSSLLLSIPLVAAFVFSYKTCRWREVILAGAVILVIISPFIYWQFLSGFGDIKILLAASKNAAKINIDTFKFYHFFLNPITQSVVVRRAALPDYPSSLLVSSPLHYLRRPLLLASFVLVPLLFLCSVIYAVTISLRASAPLAAEGFKAKVVLWVTDFLHTPYRQGLALLLIWQIILPLTLVRHSIAIYPHYYIIYLPGQFILIGIFVSKVVNLVKDYQPNWKRISGYGFIALTLCVIVAQLIGSTVSLLDSTEGHFDGNAVFPAFNDLSSLQNALNEADSVAQARHISRIYVSTTYSTGAALRYLTEQLKTPTASFDIWHCTVLPGSAAGPVVYLAESTSAIENVLINRYTDATLIDTPARLGGAPFKLFVLSAKKEPEFSAKAYTQGIHALSSNATILKSADNNDSWLSTRWQVQTATQPAPRKFDVFNFDIKFEGKKKLGADPVNCSSTSFNRGDQLITYQKIDVKDTLPSFVTLDTYSYINRPQIKHLGSLTLTTFNQVNDTPYNHLQTLDGKTIISLPVVQ